MSHTTAFKIIDYRPGSLSAAKRMPAPVPGSLAVRAVAWLSETLRRRRSRHAIASLDARMLSDIGVSWAEAETEANKPWWRA